MKRFYDLQMDENSRKTTHYLDNIRYVKKLRLQIYFSAKVTKYLCASYQFIASQSTFTIYPVIMDLDPLSVCPLQQA